jgi:uracil-DNA glycosylase
MRTDPLPSRIASRGKERESFNSLLSEVRACRLCAHALPHGVRPVIQLHPEARILIAGQAPGRRVHATGVPFDDPSGDRLRDWLGVTRDEFYDARRFALVPMGFCYPGTGSSGDLPPRPECAPAWRARVLAALTSVRLTVVLGQYAQAYHLPDAPSSVTDAVREWKRTWPTEIALPHPSPRNNGWLQRNAWFATDVLPTLRRQVRRLLAS